MPRPKTKEELSKLARANFEKLVAYVEDCPKEEQSREFPKGTLNRNIRDVLAHLHHWHLMFLEWYSVGMTGDKPEMPAKGYTWRTLPGLNKEIRKKYSDTGLEKIKSLLRSSFGEVYHIIESHSDEELFTKKKYGWTGSTSLGAYLVSATSSHYDWALKLIKKAKS